MSMKQLVNYLLGALASLCVALMVLLLVAIAWALLSPANAEASQQLAGIPVEYLLGIIGVLVTLIYGDMKKDLRRLTHESQNRSIQLQTVKFALRQVCRKLDIDFGDDED